MSVNTKGKVCIAVSIVSTAVWGFAADGTRPIHYVDLESNEVVEVRHSPLPG